MKAPKPIGRSGSVSLWRYARMFRADLLSAQPDRLYRAWMAEFRTPFFRSFLVNQPELVETVLRRHPEAFPKSKRVTAGLAPLLGQSVFVTNGEEWAKQRRIINPAFEGGRVRQAFPQILNASREACARLQEGETDIEPWASAVAADVIFRTLFSRSIDDDLAHETYRAFRDFQRVQPVLSPAALFPRLPAWQPSRARRAAKRLRALIRELVSQRWEEISQACAPDDLATRIMTTADPVTGKTFTEAEMVDQVAIFFLAGHETSAALTGWVLWLLSAANRWQQKVAKEAVAFVSAPDFARLADMKVTRDCLRETLRLYPPVPMMVREANEAMTFRDRSIRVGDQVVLSPWHLQRHERIWDAPDDFRPDRWEHPETKAAARGAYIPFSEGPRVCPGASFAMVEATVLLAVLLAEWRVEPIDTPTPVAHLTVRARDGIRLSLTKRSH